MALRILWDKYETALLIDTCLQIEQGIVSRRQAITELSKTLRQRAIDNGVQIDEIYRNENGISIQVGNVQRLLHRNPDAEAHNTKMFIDMVNMYFEDRNHFEAIMSEAKGEKRPVKTNKDRFTEWLSEKVPYTRLADYLRAIPEIEEFAKKKKIISGSLYDIDSSSTTGKIVTAINADRLFRFLHKKQMRSLMDTVQLFHKYTKENELHARDVQIQAPVVSTEVQRVDETTEAPLVESNVHIKSEPKKLAGDAISETEDAVPAVNDYNKDSDLVVDFKTATNYSFTKPVLCSYFGETFSESSWQEMFIQVCRLLYDDYPNEFKVLRDNPPHDPRSIQICNKEDAKRLISPGTIADGYYIETQCSISDLVQRLKMLLDVCRVDYENVELHYVRTDTEPLLTPKETPDYSVPSDPVIAYLESNGLECVDFRNQLGCLWVIGGVEIRNIIQILKDAGVPFYYKDSGGNATKGRAAWWTKVATSKMVLPESVYMTGNKAPEDVASAEGHPVDEEKNNDSETAKEQIEKTNSAADIEKPKAAAEGGRAEFSSWMAQQSMASTSIRTTLWALSKVEEYAVKNGLLSDTIYSVTSPIELDRIWEILNNSTDFSRYKKQNSVTAFAFNKYRAYRSGENEPARKDARDSGQPPKTVSSFAMPDDREGKRQAFIHWMQSKGYATATCNGYASALASVDDYMHQHGLAEKSIYAITDRDELSALWTSLINTKSFVKYNREQHNRFSSAVSKYAAFLRDCGQEKSGVPAIQQRPALAVKTKQADTSVHLGRKEFEDWLAVNGTPIGSIQTYADGVEQIGRYLSEKDNESRAIYTIRGIARLEHIRTALSRDTEFANYVAGSLSLDLYALKKYIAFRGNTASSGLDESLVERFSTVLRDGFENGFRFGRTIDRNRFRQLYSETFGQEISQSDEELVQILQQIGTIQEDRIFVRDGSAHSDLLDDIQEEIAHVFKNGASCVYYSEVYERYQEALANQLQVFSQDVLKQLLLSTSYGEYRASKHYFYRHTVSPDADSDIRRFMRQSPTPLNYDSIHKVLWYIPLDTIKHCLVSTPDVVNVAQETYFYAPNLPISALELTHIADLIHSELNQKSFLTDMQMRTIIERNCPSVAINTESFLTWGLRNCLSVLLKDRFAFIGPIISEKGQALNTSQVFAEFSRSHEIMTLDELKTFAKDINNGIIYWDSVFEVMVRISQDEFIPKGLIDFNVDAVDAILDDLMDGDYAPLKSFTLFLHFPSINVKWNEFVLESFVAGYSKKFSLLHASFTATECCGGIVRRNSEITDFQSLVTDVLAHSNDWQTKDGALTLLVKKGYLQRKHYTKIDTIIPEAKLLREKTDLD